MLNSLACELVTFVMMHMHMNPNIDLICVFKDVLGN